MSSFALLLILISSGMHATWNLLLRRERSELLFIRRMLVAGCMVGLIPVLLSEILIHPLGWGALAIVSFSGVCCGVYFLGLAKSYSLSDFTIVYPLVRALPILLIAVADVLLGRIPTPIGWLGMILVVIGCVLVPLTSFGDLQLRRYANLSVLWLLLAALGTVGYSLIDKTGAEYLKEQVRPGFSVAVRYTYYFFLIATMTYVLLLRCTRTRTEPDGKTVGWALPTLAAAMNMSSYALIIWVFQITGQVSYVVACRQFSIVIGVVAAVILFNEPGKLVRIVAALLVTGGLIVLSVWGREI